MSQAESAGDQLVPANGPKLLLAVQQARRHLDGLRPVLEPRDVGFRFWSRLLELTEEMCSESGAAVILRRGDVDVPLGFTLTGRVWKQQVSPWYELRIRASLAAVAAESGIPAVEPGRLSNKSGGRSEYSQAQYFVAFSGVKGARSTGASEKDTPSARQTSPEVDDATARPGPGPKTRVDTRAAAELLLAVQSAFLISQNTRSASDSSRALPVLAGLLGFLGFLAFIVSQTNLTIAILAASVDRLTSLFERLIHPWISIS